MAKRLATLFWIVTLIAIVFFATAGCASVSTLSSPASSLNQEEQIQKLLIGTWYGYIKDTPRARISYNTPTLQIFRVEKTMEKWSIALSWNGKGISDAELTINSSMIRIEFIESYGNLLISHDLTFYENRRFVGKIWYGSRSYNPAEVILNKI